MKKIIIIALIFSLIWLVSCGKEESKVWTLIEGKASTIEDLNILND
jgi:hypothetical protein